MITLRISHNLFEEMLRDLRRPHEYASERVGFMHCRQSSLRSGSLLLAHKYQPIRDDQYLEDASVGARFDGSSIREAMQTALTEATSVFHVHLHEQRGQPRFSGIDRREMRKIMPCFVNLCPERVHGALVLSADSAFANVWGADLAPEGQGPDKLSLVGPRIKLWVNHD
jgi:hypothetical protein